MKAIRIGFGVAVVGGVMAGCYVPHPPPEIDPRVVTIGTAVAGTVGPEDLTDTFTVADVDALFANGMQCDSGVTVEVQVGPTSTGALPCDRVTIGASRTDGPHPGTILVTAPGDATTQLTYAFTVANSS